MAYESGSQAETTDRDRKQVDNIKQSSQLLSRQSPGSSLMMIGGGEPGSQYLKNKGLAAKEEMLISGPDSNTNESLSHRMPVPQAFQTI